MPEPDADILTPDEAVAAIRRDFAQYPPQATLFSALVPMLLGDGATARRDPHDRGIWVHRKTEKAPRLENAAAVGEALCRALEILGNDLDLLARVCARVFRTRSAPETRGTEQYLRIETGMENFSCHLCGRCCRNLDYRYECTPEDYARWQEKGRTDIMRWAAPIVKETDVVGYSIWVVPGTRQFSGTCPWLVRGDRPDRWVCGIHDIKPAICRQYPGTRKHALMTGCPGIG